MNPQKLLEKINMEKNQKRNQLENQSKCVIF
jgi:hypothetical protein